MIPEVVGAVIVAIVGCATLVTTASLRFAAQLDPKVKKREVLLRRRNEVLKWRLDTDEALAACRAEIRRLDDALLAVESDNE